MNLKNLVSCWQNVEILLNQNDEMFIICGDYTHPDDNNPPKWRLSICWAEYPKGRNGKLAPIVIQKEVGKIILSGLMSKAILENNIELQEKINNCLKTIE